jgi:hypothetical protein
MLKRCKKSLTYLLISTLTLLTLHSSLALESASLVKSFQNPDNINKLSSSSAQLNSYDKQLIPGGYCPQNDYKVIKVLNNIRYYCILDPSKNTKGRWSKGVDVTALKDQDLTFNYNIHSSIPYFWEMELKKIIKNLSKDLPIPKEMNQHINGKTVDIYAWHTVVKNPFTSKPELKNIGISYNNAQGLVITFEMPKHSFDKNYKYTGRYAIIAHEYFHIYQYSLSGFDNQPKWLYEGAASLFEELYVQQYYGSNDLKYNLTSLSTKAKTDPKLYEKIETSNLDIEGKPMDKAYSGSTYLVLSLINQLKKSGMSEVEAYRSVLKDFPTNDKNKQWDLAFKDTFNISINEFYKRVKKERPEVNDLMPSKNLKIKDIFTIKK